MTATTEPRGGFDYGWDPGEDGWGPNMNANLLRLSRFGFHTSVLSMTTTAPPGSPTSGAGYIIPAGATGAWAGKTGQVAVWDGAAWAYAVPRDGWTVHVVNVGLVVYEDGAWSQSNLATASGVGAEPYAGVPAQTSFWRSTAAGVRAWVQLVASDITDLAATLSAYLTKNNPTFTGLLSGPGGKFGSTAASGSIKVQANNSGTGLADYDFLGGAVGNRRMTARWSDSLDSFAIMSSNDDGSARSDRLIVPRSSASPISASGGLTLSSGVFRAPYLVLNAYSGGFPTDVGALYYNETEQTYNIVRPDGSTLSIGQENTFPMKNGAGADLLDGQLVRISGAFGDNPVVSLADAGSHISSAAIGMATQAITNNATGNVATSISIVHTLDTSAYPAGTELFLSLTPGAWSATPPAKPNHQVSIGYVIRQHAVNGAILLWINSHESLGELNDVDATGAVAGNGLALGADSVWRPADFLSRQSIIDAKQLSGFVDKDTVAISYDSGARTITITHPSGTIKTMFHGKRYDIASPWVSPAHASTANTTYFYYSTDGVNYAWSTVPWQFEDIQVATVRNGTNLKFCVRECHGLMDPESHRSQHRAIWTYVQSGGTLTAGTYAVGGTASDANNTPGIDATVLRDEDLPTSINALSEGSYKVLRPSSGEFAVDSLSFPFTVTPSGYINYYATDSATQGATGKYYNVYVVGIPTTSASDQYRWVFIAPQAQYDSIDAASAESFEGLRLGDLAGGVSEYCPRYRLIYGANASHATTGKVRLDAVQLLERSPLRSTSTSVAPISGTGSAGLPAVWAGPTSLTYQDAATFRSTIGVMPYLVLTGAVSADAINGGLSCFAEIRPSSLTNFPSFVTTARGCALWQSVGAGGRLMQLVQSPDGPMAQRTQYDGGVWGSWISLWDTFDLPVSTFMKTVLDDATAAAARSTLGLGAIDLLIHSDFGRSATTDVWQSAFTNNAASGLQLSANSIATGTEITIEQVLTIPADGGASVYQVYIGPQLTGEDAPTGSTYIDVIDPEVEYGTGTLRIKIELIGSGSSITGYVTSTFFASLSGAPFVRTGAITVNGTIANSIDIRFNPDSNTGYIIRRNRVFRRNP